MNLNKRALVIALIGLAGILFSPIVLNAYITHNSTEHAYDETGEERSAVTSSGSTIARLVVRSAGSFLDSHSAYLAFLKKIEMSDLDGIDYGETGQVLDGSIKAMEEAVDFYQQLKDTAERTPYNYDMYWNLVFFDFYRFESDNGLNHTVFSRVHYFLSNGDVRGCYGYTLKKCRSILEGLYKAKSSIKAGQFPEMKNLWRLNQSFSDTLLFGQYVAEIFCSLTNH